MRVAIYSRAFIADEKSVVEQSKMLREYAKAQGWAVVIDIQETADERGKRREREKCLAAAQQRLIDKVLVFSLDRWGTSIPDLAATLRLLEEAGTGFLSLAENLDILASGSWRATDLLEVVAAFGSALQRERVRAGLEFVRRQNRTKLGRPSKTQNLAGKIQRLHKQNLSKTEIAKRVGIDRRSVGRVLAALTAPAPTEKKK